MRKLMQTIISVLIALLIIIMVISLLPIILPIVIVIIAVSFFYIWYAKKKFMQNMQGYEEEAMPNQEQRNSSNEDIIDVEFNEYEDSEEKA